MKCDFCSSKDVAWSYPCHDFMILNYGIASDGPWAACEECHALIEKEQWMDLHLRSAETHPLRGQVSMLTLVNIMADVHEAFKIGRAGRAPHRVDALRPEPKVNVKANREKN